jgi:hypothetical protein
MHSPAWRALSMAERGLYVEIRKQLNSSNNGNISATMTTLKHAGVNSSATLAKGLRSMLAVGLIDKMRQGGIAWGQKVCSLYRFTDEAVFDFPKLGIKAMSATNDWRKFERIKDATRAIEAAHEDAKRKPADSKSGLQEVKRVDSVCEASSATNASASEAEGGTPAQFLKQPQRPETALEPA